MPRASEAPKLADLALAFTVLSLSGLGGVGATARYHLVTRRGWLTEREFADAFGIGQILPGANIANVCVIIGDRFCGPLGVVVCLAALWRAARLSVSLVTLALIVSIISFGAGFAIIIPQIHVVFVNQLRWLSDQQFTEVVAVSHASPGPNFQMVPLIGWRAGGPIGAVVALASFATIPALLSILVGRAIRHASENPDVILLQRSLRSVSAGLWFASGIELGWTVDHRPVQFSGLKGVRVSLR